MSTGPDTTTLRGDLAAIWRDVLEVAEVKPESDFFELGGESVSAIHLAARIENDLAVPCTIEDIFDNPTFGELADVVAQRS